MTYDNWKSTNPADEWRDWEPEVDADEISCHPLITISASEIQSLADRLFGRGISSLSTYSTREKQDLIAASRVIRELARRVDRATGRSLVAIVIQGG
jgi:hypothetical protein